jgi:hypothetical protein
LHDEKEMGRLWCHGIRTNQHFLAPKDPRLNFLFAVTRHLDGGMFTPSGLWDAAGNTLLHADGHWIPSRPA